jgi:hypothetical protein
VNTSRRKRSISVLSNNPLGTSPPKRVIRSAQRASRGANSSSRHHCVARRGRLAARRMYSKKAGRMNVSGRNCTSSLSPVMKIRHISAVSMRLARAAARKAPLLTPT